MGSLNSEVSQRNGKTHSLKHSILCTVAFPRNDSCSSNQSCRQVIDNVTIQVWHHQHIKLVWVLDQLRNVKKIGTNLNMKSA